MRAVGVGNWDEIVRVGGWDVGRQPPLALGVEAAGVVTEVGENVTSFAPGDEVLTHPVPLRHQGAWAQLLVAPAAPVAPKLAAAPWDTAARSLCPRSPPTRRSRGRSFPGREVGARARRWRRDRRPHRAARDGARSERRRNGRPLERSRVRDYGAHVVLDYHDPDWPAGVRDASPGGGGVGAAVNAARGGAASALQAVADGGRLATITGDPPTPERGITVANVYVQADGARLAGLAEALNDGLLSLNVGATFALGDAATALQGAVTGRAAGAIVLTLDHSSEP